MASPQVVPAATVTTDAKPHGQQQLARDVEVERAVMGQRAPPLDHVQVAAVRAAWHQWWPSLRALPGETPLRAMLFT